MKINLIYAKMVKVYDYFPTYRTQLTSPTHLHQQQNMHHHQTCGYYKNLVILELKKLFDLMTIHNKL